MDATKRTWDAIRNGRAAVACIVGLTALSALALTGCPQAERPAGTATATDTPAADVHAGGEHAHRAMHGGQIQAVGDYHFELAYESSGRFALYVMGSDETQPLPIAAETIELQVRNETADALRTLALLPAPLDGESPGTSSRFAAESDELTSLVDFTALARIPVEKDSWRASFQFVGGRPIGETLAAIDGFACPMHCEKEKVYGEPGECPVCHMKLEEARGGTVAHADHAAKHGGVFFMAADNWHHLEGTLPAPRELRIYLYDNFTQPLAAAGYSGTLVVQPVDEEGDETGEAATVPLTPVDGETWLVAELPEGFRPPYQTEARVKFPKQEQELLFNFDFQEPQGE